MTIVDDAPDVRPASGPDRPPRGPRVWTALGSIAAVVGVVFAGMWLASALAHRTEVVHRSFDAAGLSTIDISIDSGDVHVVGDPSATTVELRQRVTDGLFGTTHSARLEGHRLVVRGGCPVFWSTHCAVDVNAVVPAGTRVVVHTNDGLNDASAISGPARLTTDNGTVRGSSLSGDLSVESNNGDVSLARLSSPTVSVDTDNGDAVLGFVREPTTVVTHANNGDVTIELPTGRATYALHTATNNGDVSTPIRTDPSSRRQIRAASDNGDITIRYSGGR